MAAADALRPAAALVGIGLPDGDGVALTHALIALPWRPRVVLTSTDPDAASPDDVRGCGAGALVPKDGSAQRAARRSARARLAGWITSAMCRGRCG
jgi:DNA-binding NarL/FixJ family response regulator